MNTRLLPASRVSLEPHLGSFHLLTQFGLQPCVKQLQISTMSPIAKTRRASILPRMSVLYPEAGQGSPVSLLLWAMCECLEWPSPLALLLMTLHSYLGFQVPDYTAYSQSLEVFRKLVPIPTAYDCLLLIGVHIAYFIVRLEADNGYQLDIVQTKVCPCGFILFSELTRILERHSSPRSKRYSCFEST